MQLLKPRGGSLWLPEGRIEDWPDLQLRQIYWDDAHHLDRPEALKKAIRQAAFFKLNGFALKLEGHFQFKSAPAIVEPYALSPAEYQDLTNYGLKYHVELIPYLDGPAHIAFILKHPEYAKLREYPDSNYELCVTNPDSYKLTFAMFQDLLDANQGVKHFYLSTDEPYYVGMADNSQCQEAARAKELGSVGKTAGGVRDQDRRLPARSRPDGDVLGRVSDEAGRHRVPALSRGQRRGIRTAVRSGFPQTRDSGDDLHVQPGRRGAAVPRLLPVPVIPAAASRRARSPTASWTPFARFPMTRRAAMPT